MEQRLRTKLTIGAGVLALAAAGGGAYAATQSNSANSRQAYLNDVAKRLGTSPQKLNQALEQAFFDRLDAAVQAGRLTSAQADEIKKRVQQTGVVPFGGRGFFGHEGHHGFFGGPGGPGGPGGRAGIFSAAAKYLGLSEAQLAGQLGSGHSLAQLAKQRNKSTSGLQDAMLAAAKSGLDNAVKSKRLSSSQETQILNRLKTEISRIVNHAPPRGIRPGWPHHGGPPGRSGAFPGPPGGGAAFGGPPPGGAADFDGQPPDGPGPPGPPPGA